MRKLRIILLITLLTLSFLLLPHFAEEGEYRSSTKVRTHGSSWILSSIFINDTDPEHDWDHTESLHEWLFGSGTAEDPYIVENITFVGVDSTPHLTILNSNKSFFIRNCTFLSGSTSVPRVFINNVSNGYFTRLFFIETGWAFHSFKSSNNTISYASIQNEGSHSRGIVLEQTSHSVVRFSNFSFGGDKSVHLIDSAHSTLEHNVFTQWNTYGIYAETSFNISMSHNVFFNTDYIAIRLFNSDSCIIRSNVINNTGFDAIALYESSDTLITRNNISKTTYTGLTLTGSSYSGNLIYLNNFTINSQHAYESIPMGSSWDDGSIGNYWDDYDGIDADDDGIGDTPYHIPIDSLDFFPIWWDGNDTLTPFYLTTDSLSPNTNGSFTLNWTESENAHSYSIYRHLSYITEINSSVTMIADGLLLTEHSFTDHDDGAFYFVVLARNRYDGNLTSNSIFINITNHVTHFTLYSTAGSPDREGIFTLIWTPSSHADTYVIYRHDSPLFNLSDASVVIMGVTTELEISVNMDSGIHHFTVLAINEYSNLTSNSISVTVDRDPHPFILFTDPETPSSAPFTLIWTISINADNYTLYRHDSLITSINDTLTVLTLETITRFKLVTALQEGTHYFIVVSHNKHSSVLSNLLVIEIEPAHDDDTTPPPPDNDIVPPPLFDLELVLLGLFILSLSILIVAIYLYMRRARRLDLKWAIFKK